MFEYKLTTMFNWQGTALYAGKIQVGYIARKSHRYNAYTHNRKFIGAFDLQNDARAACETEAIKNLIEFDNNT